MQFYFKIHVSVLEKTKTKDEIKFKTHLWQPSWERIRDDIGPHDLFCRGTMIVLNLAHQHLHLVLLWKWKDFKRIEMLFYLWMQISFLFSEKKNYQNKSVKRTCLQSVYILIDIHQNSESYVHSRADQQNINISYFLRWQRKSNYKN